jgi:hypothetical protein
MRGEPSGSVAGDGSLEGVIALEQAAANISAAGASPAL